MLRKFCALRNSALYDSLDSYLRFFIPRFPPARSFIGLATGYWSLESPNLPICYENFALYDSLDSYIPSAFHSAFSRWIIALARSVIGLTTGYSSLKSPKSAHQDAFGVKTTEKCFTDVLIYKTSIYRKVNEVINDCACEKFVRENQAGVCRTCIASPRALLLSV